MCPDELRPHRLERCALDLEGRWGVRESQLNGERSGHVLSGRRARAHQRFPDTLTSLPARSERLVQHLGPDAPVLDEELA